MKKSLIILASFFALNGFSQSSIQLSSRTGTNNFAALTSMTIDLTTAPNAETDIDIDIKNISSSTKSYNVKRYDILLHTAASTTADAHFCFNQSCFGAGTYSNGAVTLNPGISTSDLQGVNQYLTAELVEASTVGASVVKYTFFENSNHADSAQVTIRYNNVTGINELNNSLSSLELYPNPATDVTVLKVNSQKAMDAKVIIYNALGAVVSEMPVAILEGKNKVEVNVNQLNSGIYFAQIKMANSSVTKKLVIK